MSSAKLTNSIVLNDVKSIESIGATALRSITPLGRYSPGLEPSVDKTSFISSTLLFILNLQIRT